MTTDGNSATTAFDNDAVSRAPDSDLSTAAADTGVRRRSKPAAAKTGGATRPAASPAALSGAKLLLLDRLLAMAQRFRAEGKLCEAMELYWELAEEQAGTAEANAAGAMLLELAADYERNNAPHMARSIYQRLMATGAG